MSKLNLLLYEDETEAATKSPEMQTTFLLLNATNWNDINHQKENCSGKHQINKAPRQYLHEINKKIISFFGPFVFNWKNANNAIIPAGFYLNVINLLSCIDCYCDFFFQFKIDFKVERARGVRAGFPYSFHFRNDNAVSVHFKRDEFGDFEVFKSGRLTDFAKKKKHKQTIFD